MPTCKICNKQFKSWVKIEGKRHNFTKRTQCLDCSPLYSRLKLGNNLNNTTTHKQCCNCKQILERANFHKSQQRCKPCDRIESNKSDRKFKQKCIEQLGGKCSICSYNKSIHALECHHTKGKKTQQISYLSHRSFSSKLVQDELSKCELLCKNCHREHHYSSKPKNLIKLEINGKICTKCNQSLSLDSYYGRMKSCKNCWNEFVKIKILNFKSECINYKGRKCQQCGYNQCISALEFHHINPENKSFEISKYSKRKFDKTSKAELDKCVLLCANCHAEEHELIWSTLIQDTNFV